MPKLQLGKITVQLPAGFPVAQPLPIRRITEKNALFFRPLHFLQRLKRQVYFSGKTRLSKMTACQVQRGWIQIRARNGVDSIRIAGRE